ncbi:MAG: FAD-dependent oxidoreductase [Solirubrobacteraceae bacterium]
MSSASEQPFRVLIAGGGVAGVEAALALREMAGQRAEIVMLAPQPDFVYRPLRVQEPFAAFGAGRYPLEDIARDLNLELRRDGLGSLQPERSTLLTLAGEPLSYDALLLAPGARAQSALRHALTIDDARLDEQLHGLIQDVEGGYTRKLAFIVPEGLGWPLPIYELALMTARRAWEMNTEISVTLVTPEPAPLSIFGETASRAVQGLLDENGVLAVCATTAETPEPGQVALVPGERVLHVERVIALPQLLGPSVPGAPADDRGFIPVDSGCRVRGLERVWAAGDATDYPVKHGGLAAQQADAAASAIAALTGANVEPLSFEPVIHGVLLGGRHPLHLSARLTPEGPVQSSAGDEPARPDATKIAARYLGPYLSSHAGSARH